MIPSKKPQRPPIVAEYLLKRLFPDDGNYSIIGDMEEDYNRQIVRKGVIRAKIWFWNQLFLMATPWILNSIRWEAAMFRENMKLASRNVWKHRGYSLINVLGLAMGLACSLLIILYVTNELQYDAYHKDADRIHRIAVHGKSALGEYKMAISPSPLVPELKANYPQIESAARVISADSQIQQTLLIQYEKTKFYEEDVWFVDPDIFNVFDIKFIYGDPETAISAPDKVVITQSMAKKYFGDSYPVGKTLKVRADDWRHPSDFQNYEISAVIEDVPDNSHFRYKFLLSMGSLLRYRENINTEYGGFMACYSYLKVASDYDWETFPEITASLAQKTLDGMGEWGESFEFYKFYLEPITSIHMYSETINAPSSDRRGNWLYIYVYSIIGLLILLIGCMNYMNLTAALSIKKTKEVGLRKVFGAQRYQLIRQYIGETFFITCLAFLLAFPIVYLLINMFNQMEGINLSLAGLKQPVVFIPLIVLMVIISILSGSYPAFILSSFQPISILKKTFTLRHKGSFVQRSLVIGQFAISILLIVCTVTVYRQLDFMKGGALGFSKDQKLILPVKMNSNHFVQSWEQIKNDFLQHNEISAVAASSSVPCQFRGGTYMMDPNRETLSDTHFRYLSVDEDFFDQYDLKMIAGNRIGEKIEMGENVIILNESGMKDLGYSSPEEIIGQEMKISVTGRVSKVVGVCKDFHISGMQENVRPMVIEAFPYMFRYLTLTVSSENLNETLKFAEMKWGEHFPTTPYEYFFLDDEFDKQYRYEEQVSRLLTIITTMGISIACLGLFGMVSFIAQQKRREIGIRKVIGASIGDIVRLLSRQFILLIFSAGVIATPIAWFAMNRWLQDFAYRINLGWAVFIIAGGSALLIAIVTVIFQGIKVASDNPVESIRSE
jgi:putative ABC transport system permease protein